MRNPFETEEHQAFRDSVRNFVEREIRPYADEWDEACAPYLIERRGHA